MSINELVVVAVILATSPPGNDIVTTGEPAVALGSTGPSSHEPPRLSYSTHVKANCGEYSLAVKTNHTERERAYGPTSVVISVFNLRRNGELALAGSDTLGDLSDHNIVSIAPDCVGGIMGLELLLAPNDTQTPFRRRYFQFDGGEVSFKLEETYTSLERLRFIYR